MNSDNDIGLALWKPYPSMLAVQRDNLFALDSGLLEHPGPRIVDGATAVCEELGLARRRRGAHQ